MILAISRILTFAFVVVTARPTDGQFHAKHEQSQLQN